MDIPEPSKAVQQALVMQQNLHRELDFLATVLSFRLGGPLCIPDCGICCHQSFPIPKFSGLYIAVAINTFPEDDRQHIVEQLEKWLLKEVPEVRFRFSSDGQAEEEVRIREYRLTHRLSCPLLSSDTKCLIYPWRDVVCRAYTVTRPSPKNCPRPYLKGESPGDRRFITTKISLEPQRTAIISLLKERAPEWLGMYWMPALVYAFLEPEKWAKLSKRVQQTKYASYHSDNLWLITAEDVRDSALEHPEGVEAVRELNTEPILIE